MLSPVVLFVYKRPEHTRRVIASLAENILAEETELFIFSDAAKTEKDIKLVGEVRHYINLQDWKKAFKSVTVYESMDNKGLANSIIEGITEIINRYGKVIVLEDDLILSKHFLEYMNEALEFYKDVSDIWSISGYSFPMKALNRYPHNVFYSYRGCSWGWATWKDRWEKVDWNISQYPVFIENKKWIKRFNRGGKDLTGMLTMQVEGKIDSWAIRWCFEQSNLNMYTIYPKFSYVKNGGCDGSGTHSGVSKDFDTILCNEKLDEFEILSIEKRIAREFWGKYSDTFLKKVRRKLKKLF